MEKIGKLLQRKKRKRKEIKRRKEIMITLKRICLYKTKKCGYLRQVKMKEIFLFPAFKLPELNKRRNMQEEMNIKYLQECISYKDNDIEGKNVYVPGYSENSNNNVCYAELQKSCSTENPCIDCEDSNKTKCLSVRCASSSEAKRSYADDNDEDNSFKEILFTSTDISSKSIQSIISESKYRKTENEKFGTSLGHICSEDQYREEYEAEQKSLNSGETVLNDDVSGKLQDINLKADSPLTAGFGEDGKTLLGFVVCFFLVAVYPGFFIILSAYVALVPSCSVSRKRETYGENEKKLQERRRREEKMMKNIKEGKIMRSREIQIDTLEMPNSYFHAQSNIQVSADRNLSLYNDRYNNNEISDARDMLEDALFICSKATSNEFKVLLKLEKAKSSDNNFLGQDHSKRATQSSWTLVEDSNQSNSRLSPLEENYSNLNDDSTVSVRIKTMENYNVQTFNLDMSEDCFHSQTYVGEFLTNGSDSGLLNISYIVNEISGGKEQKKPSNLPNKIWGRGWCEMLLKAADNRPSISSKATNDCLKDTDESFSASSGNNGLDIAFAIKSRSEKTYVDNYNKTSYILTGKAGRSKQMANRENDKMQKWECNMGNDHFQGQINISDLCDNCFPNDSCNDDGTIQEENDKNDESTEKLGSDHKNPVTDDHKLCELNRDPAAHHSICNQSNDTSGVSITYLKRGDKKCDKNLMKLQGPTKLVTIHSTIDEAKVTQKMLAYQREVLYIKLFDRKNYINSQKCLLQSLHFGFSYQIVVYLGYMSSSNTFPVNNEADEESDHSMDDGNEGDVDDGQDEEDDYQNSGIVERNIHSFFVPLVCHEELHDHYVSIEGENQHQNVVGDNFQPVMPLLNQDDNQNDISMANVEGTYIVPDNQNDDIAENIVAIREVPNNINGAEMSVVENENALMDENVPAINDGSFHPAVDGIPESEYLNTESVVAIHIDLHQFDVEEDFENNLIANENINFHDIN